MIFKKEVTAVIFASLSMVAATNVSAATITVTETGSLGVSSSPATDTWDISVWGEGSLEITLVEADYSEWFTWGLSGSATGGGALGPQQATPPVGPVNTSLGTWSTGAGTSAFSFTSTNNPSSSVPVDYTIEFAFTPAPLVLDPNIDYITVTPSAVPVPAAVWLFGSGLIGLAGFARRKKA